MHVLGISGSLRAASYNSGLLRAAQEAAPPGVAVEIFDGLAAIPPYDGDIEAAGDPDPVLSLKRAIAGADALLLASPEYNRGMSGVLKNAIDWASRPARASVRDRKPVALLGASTGIGGTAGAQAQLRDALAFPGAQTMPEPELHVSRARDKFDVDGRLTDELTRGALHLLLEALAEWTDRVRAVAAAA